MLYFEDDVNVILKVHLLFLDMWSLYKQLTDVRTGCSLEIYNDAALPSDLSVLAVNTLHFTKLNKLCRITERWNMCKSDRNIVFFRLCRYYVYDIFFK